MRTMIGMVMVALLLVSGCKDTGQSTEKNTSTAQTQEKSLKFIAPAGVTIARGGKEDVTIKLERKSFADDVTVKFDGLAQRASTSSAPPA